jgi:hypothetical protein
VSVYEVPAVVPSWIPRTETAYPATPTLSEEALQPSVAVVSVLAIWATPDGLVGADESAHAAVDTIASDDFWEWFRDASKAITWTEYVFPHASPVLVKVGRGVTSRAFG